jgi:8-oxo-dGTP diphosphatase
MEKEIISTFGNKLRVRTCGILIDNEKILLIKHHALGDREFLLCPPGGGVHFEESLHDSLIREFKEETGLEVEVKELLFVNEYIETPLHAIELFFEVKKTGGNLCLGTDPELGAQQIITEIDWFSIEELHQIIDHHKHSCLHKIKNFEELKNKDSLY